MHKPLSAKTDLKNLNRGEIGDFLESLGQKRFHASQILRWIYQRGVVDFAAMTDLSKDLRGKLENIVFVSELQREAVEVSRDGTRKFLFRLADGERIETVLIPMEKGRNTLCVSTQAGCAMQCAFCLTGSFGLVRNLSAAEIVNQVSAVRRDDEVDNIVLMGMGEPLHNLDNVVKALDILYDDKGFCYGSRKVTLSTCGLVPAMVELGVRSKVGLAVSLNATTDEIRSRLMPVNRRYPLAELMAACRAYPLQPRQRITFEYILISGVNDSQADAKRLVRLLHGIPAKVNLIAYNEHSGSPFKTPPEEAIAAFQSHLLSRNLVAVRRASKGRDISAACGQLKGKSADL
ncbi:MAG TPA: 23S rRNA (adenine(2503)-C(2))-methyltransferase RlmN [Desulfuromonadales bacterium]|nr:23S rRNA (adenine(2503)-C(2))-methyltransferase RlmN [Desulfuromonadales bacterium]